MSNHDPLNSSPDQTAGERGGFVALAVLAAALGAGAALMLAPAEGAHTRERVARGFRTLQGEASGTIAQLQREIRKRRRQSRREREIIAVAGLLLGAGITALLTPDSGAVTRKRLGGTLNRLKVGAVDRIDRLRQGETTEEAGEQSAPVRRVQQSGQGPNTIL